ncbi:MAG: response regulator [Chitinivibrionales bacterium]|nr:response regulator [Chitinivibrionales bacterium]MBD3357707.1 response regulator [Chitinivibrionales bacterium]
MSGLPLVHDNDTENNRMAAPTCSNTLAGSIFGGNWMIAKSDVTVLVVDDEPEIRSLIADYLSDEEGYKVLEAENGRDALDNIIPNCKVDLVLSDINMPVMKGFDLLNEVRRHYPYIKRVLITAYNVEDYLELALKHDVGNIFVKTTPFNFAELSACLECLLTGNIFGAERYFDSPAQRRSVMVKRGDCVAESAARIIALLPQTTIPSKLELVLIELLTNAVFYGVRNERPDRKEGWNHDFELSDEEAVQVSVMWDAEKHAVSIVDTGGKLKKRDVLYWLNRQVSRDEQGMPVGLFDSHGRGLFIARKYIDRMIINIDRARKTELIVVNYHDKSFEGYKPLYINEL